MEGQERFKRMVSDTLAGYGIEADETDLAVLAGIELVYGPDRVALLDADLSMVVPEHDFDPGRAPTDHGRAG